MRISLYISAVFIRKEERSSLNNYFFRLSSYMYIFLTAALSALNVKEGIGLLCYLPLSLYILYIFILYVLPFYSSLIFVVYFYFFFFFQKTFILSCSILSPIPSKYFISRPLFVSLLVSLSLFLSQDFCLCLSFSIFLSLCLVSSVH